jgi:hypothetical protein
VPEILEDQVEEVDREVQFLDHYHQQDLEILHQLVHRRVIQEDKEMKLHIQEEEIQILEQEEEVEQAHQEQVVMLVQEDQDHL